jgi:hypothetical protein
VNKSVICQKFSISANFHIPLHDRVFVYSKQWYVSLFLNGQMVQVKCIADNIFMSHYLHSFIFTHQNSSKLPSQYHVNGLTTLSGLRHLFCRTYPDSSMFLKSMSYTLWTYELIVIWNYVSSVGIAWNRRNEISTSGWNAGTIMCGCDILPIKIRGVVNYKNLSVLVKES